MIRNCICCLVFLMGGLAAFSQSGAKADTYVYVCPPCGDCDTIQYTHAGVCPHCGMTLEKISLVAWQERLKTAGSGKKIAVCFYLQDGIEVLDFAGPMEVFTAAGFNVFTVSRTKGVIRSQGVLSLQADYDIHDAPPADVVVFFGGDTRASVSDTALLAWVRARSMSSTYTMSVCTGAFILGKAGVLDNLTATTYHASIDALGRQLPKTKVLSNVRFVDNGRVITTAGVSAGTDGALHVVEKIRGREYAKEVAENIEYDKWVPDQGLVIAGK